MFHVGMLLIIGLFFCLPSTKGFIVVSQHRHPDSSIISQARFHPSAITTTSSTRCTNADLTLKRLYHGTQLYGYGPSDRNRHGWCWRDEHGSGIRMSPYFATEADCNAFHNFFHKNYKNDQKTKESQRLDALMGLQFGLIGPSLRNYKLREVNKIAKYFHKANPTLITPIHAPVGETLWEFFKYENPYYRVPEFDFD